MAKKTIEELEEMYDYVESFWEGLAVVQHAGEWFHVRPDGTPAYAARFDWVGAFNDALADARKDNEELTIDMRGKKVD
jgi:hypothetical protein